MNDTTKNYRALLKHDVGGLGSAVSVGANSCSAKGWQPSEQLPCREGYRGALQLPPMYQVYDQCKKANTIVTIKHTLKIFLNAKRGN